MVKSVVIDNVTIRTADSGIPNPNLVHGPWPLPADGNIWKKDMYYVYSAQNGASPSQQ